MSCFDVLREVFPSGFTDENLRKKIEASDFPLSIKDNIDHSFAYRYFDKVVEAFSKLNLIPELLNIYRKSNLERIIYSTYSDLTYQQKIYNLLKDHLTPFEILSFELIWQNTERGKRLSFLYKKTIEKEGPEFIIQDSDQELLRFLFHYNLPNHIGSTTIQTFDLGEIIVNRFEKFCFVGMIPDTEVYQAVEKALDRLETYRSKCEKTSIRLRSLLPI